MSDEQTAIEQFCQAVADLLARLTWPEALRTPEPPATA